jgi:hypothetical protein
MSKRVSGWATVALALLRLAAPGDVAAERFAYLDEDVCWIKSEGDWHGGVYERELERTGQDVCAACHGVDHRGRRLARTSADRVLRDDEGTVRAIVPEGTAISCGLCHTLAKSFKE